MAPRTKVNPAAEMWDAVSKEIASTSMMGTVQYLKAGEQVIKFCVPEGASPTTFFAAFDDIDMNGLPRTAYLVSGLIVEADDEEIVNETQVRYIKVTKTVLDAIIAGLKKGWDFLGDDGELFSITKLSKKPWYEASGVLKSSFDSSNAVFPEISIKDAALEEAERVAERNEEKNPKATKKSKKDDDEAPF